MTGQSIPQRWLWKTDGSVTGRPRQADGSGSPRHREAYRRPKASVCVRSESCVALLHHSFTSKLCTYSLPDAPCRLLYDSCCCRSRGRSVHTPREPEPPLTSCSASEGSHDIYSELLTNNGVLSRSPTDLADAPCWRGASQWISGKIEPPPVPRARWEQVLSTLSQALRASHLCLQRVRNNIIHWACYHKEAERTDSEGRQLDPGRVYSAAAPSPWALVVQGVARSPPMHRDVREAESLFFLVAMTLP